MFHFLPHFTISLLITSILNPSSIEIIFHDSNDIPKQTEGLRNQSDPNINQAIHSQRRCLPERIHKKFFWIKHVRYETLFCCPVCPQKGLIIQVDASAYICCTVVFAVRYPRQEDSTQSGQFMNDKYAETRLAYFICIK